MVHPLVIKEGLNYRLFRVRGDFLDCRQCIFEARFESRRALALHLGKNTIPPGSLFVRHAPLLFHPYRHLLCLTRPSRSFMTNLFFDMIRH